MTTAAAAPPLPPADLRERVSGTRDAEWFDASGAATVGEWEEVLRRTGRDLRDFPAVLDFGCGSGRALRHLARRLGEDQRLFGLDTDAAAVAWVCANLPEVRAAALDPLPPSPIPDRSIDLILSHSVFTHLPEDVQTAWLGDLHRILRPGGVLVASIHGRKAATGFLQSVASSPGGAERAKAIADRLDDRGFHHIEGRTPGESSYPQYYGAAFHTIAYVASVWLARFDLCGWFPTFALNHQDVLVLRAKETKSLRTAGC